MLLIYGAALMAVLLLFQSLSKPANSISYSRFRDLVSEGRVTDVKLGNVREFVECRLMWKRIKRRNRDAPTASKSHHVSVACIEGRLSHV